MNIQGLWNTSLSTSKSARLRVSYASSVVEHPEFFAMHSTCDAGAPLFYDYENNQVLRFRLLSQMTFCRQCEHYNPFSRAIVGRLFTLLSPIRIEDSARPQEYSKITSTASQSKHFTYRGNFGAIEVTILHIVLRTYIPSNI